MKKAIVFLILSIVISCGNIDSYPPVVTIKSPPDGSIFFVGDTVEIEAQILDLDKNTDQITYIIDDNTMEHCDHYPCIYYWKTEEYRVGEHKIKVRAIDLDQRTGKDEITIILKEPAKKVTD